ncbi:MAG: ATP-binding protein [Alphaproteobacteria bacterium]|nr:ATP-binding protein [Alphaproteobacteria bacterium]
MKKLPKNHQIWQSRIANRILKKHNKKIKKRKRRIRKRLSDAMNRGAISTPLAKGIVAPKQFDLQPQHVRNMRLFFQKVREKIKVGGVLLLNFSQTKQMTALGAVYLYSEIDSMLISGKIPGQAKIQVSYGQSQKSSQVRTVLEISGFLNLCGHPNPPTINTFLPVVRGENDQQLPNITSFLVSTALRRGQITTQNQDYAESLVNKAIGEAMLNVKNHAYPERMSGRFWWTMATIFEENLHVVLCDRGVGIPHTLHGKSWFQKVSRKISSKTSDAEMIKSAMKYARSSRKKFSGVGLGSRDIQMLVRETGRGHLTIISGKGHYHLDGASKREKPVEIGYDVGGTLIHWRIPLQKPQKPSGGPS